MSCQTDDDGERTVRGKLVDKDGGEQVYQATVRIDNANPQAELSGGGSLAEGKEVTIQFADPFDPSTADTEAGFHYAFACDGALPEITTFEDSGEAASVICQFDDGPSTATVRARIIDRNDGFSEYTTTVEVTNVPPTASFGAPEAVGEGSTIDLTFTGAIDSSSADIAAGFDYAFDCGDGYGEFGAASTFSCPTSNQGERTVRGKLRDKDDGETEYAATVLVNNVLPTANFEVPRLSTRRARSTWR